MNEKEVAEIRRRFRADKSNISAVRGCYVSEDGEILSEFSQSLGLMSNEQAELLLGLFKKSLSGTIGKHLAEIEFPTEQVVSGREHQLLMTLRQSALKDEDAVHAFYQEVIGTLKMESTYLILLAHDSYDVPGRMVDGELQYDGADEVYSYIICAVCPLKLTRAGLSYYNPDRCFRTIAADHAICAPELGFVFPAFDDRRSNIYGALYYMKDLGNNYQDFADAVFRSEVPMAADEQQELFQAVLSDAVAEDCSMEVAQAVHDQLTGLVMENKENKGEEPLRFGKDTVRQVLRDCGVSDPRVEAFEQQFDEQFGADAALNPVSVVNPSKIEVKTNDVTITVSPERSDLIKTKLIDGVQCIVIRAEDGVTVNGISIHIAE